jgi:chorismate dehydratase
LIHPGKPIVGRGWAGKNGSRVPVTSTVMKPRVSVVQYLNTAPLVWGMVHGSLRGRFDLAFTTPACCAEDLRAGRAEVGIVPSIEYQRISGLMLLPGMAIASKKRVRSVLLLARVPIEQVRSVALDTSSRTSAALVEVLLRKFHQLEVVTRPANPDPDAMLRNADAALLIGDPALVYAGTARVYDLAEEWRRLTGLPFVFAVWAFRPGPDLDPATTGRDFALSRDEGLAHVEDIAVEWAPRLGLTPQAVQIYLTENIDYTLDEENLAGLRLFYQFAHEVGAAPGVRELDFA